MTEISFYHLQQAPLALALPKLLEKTLAAGKRAVVVVGSEERAEALSGDLWTYSPDSWLPHGTEKDGHPADQPVWLTTKDENPNGATFLFLADGAESAKVADFERCFDLFDGNDDDAVKAARDRWAAYRAAGHDLAYWQQTESGGWEKKA
ncbi:MAG: DNA polymerase III subunit chi [Rhodospirillales bacterium]|nr:DNA polymerase III subunit chi [Rhodospirillales bacterium]MCW8861004.1 DNA polymerase III subunit chi [Rhodospirillales bacterium]MCW8970557.1 DNA polymerase III subunit chi [Rhodospirillales bacterium]MCW9001561.1 DNA polymerase III subunit chi [Rhodospirillales bacterium]MCW9038990.1 DNA polymerase III subunit chi [Rhodospirillales bacterium]